MKNKYVAVIAVIALILSLHTVGISAQAMPEISADNVVADGESVSVPIRIKDNTGICGGTISVSYTEGLTLADIEKGAAFSSLTMTKPGDFSANPFNIVWDGTDADTSNGVIAILKFNVPKASKVYDIALSCKTGGMVDGDLKPVSVKLSNGSITVGAYSQTMPEISADNVVADGESVSVPIRIKDNTGICGGTISVSYTEGLTLADIEKGAAFSSLTMTKPGDFSANPFNIVWDGTDADSSNGVIAILKFNVPKTSKVYDVTLSCKTGGMVDGDLKPVSVKLSNGSITVNASNKITVKVNSKQTTLNNTSGKSGVIYIALYDASNKLISINSYPTNTSSITATAGKSAQYAKILWWDNITSIKPLTDSKIITLR